MKPKYTKGQKVKIVSAGDQQLQSRYQDVGRYASRTGTVVESIWVGIRGMSFTIDHYLYRVRIEEDEVTIPGEAPELWAESQGA